MTYPPLAMSTPAWIGSFVFGIFFGWVLLTYNAFVRLSNRVKEAFSGIDVQLKRRHDLVPNLVSVVKGYAKHEQDTLTAVVEARDQAKAAERIDDRGIREATLSKQVNKLMGLVESYPELKADKNFRKLHGDLVEIEDHLQYARRYYNGTVRDWNIRIQSFPANLLAGALGKKSQDFFQVDASDERSVPMIDFDDAG